MTAECPPPLSLSLVLSFRLCLSLFLITALSQPMIAISESACDDSIVVMVRRTKPSRAHSREKERDLSIYFLLFDLSFSQTAREYTNKIIQNKAITKEIKNFLGVLKRLIFLNISFEIIIKKAKPQR